MPLRRVLAAGQDPSVEAETHGTQRSFYFGVLLLASTFVFFFVTMYALVVSKFMPDTGNAVLDWITHDQYYCLLVPLCIPTLTVFVYVNWLSMKSFRHN